MSVYASSHARDIATHAHPTDRVRRLEGLLATLTERHGQNHPLTRRVAEQLDRARRDAALIGEAR